MQMIQLEPAIKSLFAAEAEFVISGGVAVVFHGSAYVTQDLDFCFLRTKSNIEKIVLIEVNIKLMMAHFVEDDDGRVVRRFDVLELERSAVSFFPLAWTVVHPINEQSPLNNLTHEDLKTADAEFLILLTAIDETFAQPVHTRSSYKPPDIAWNAKFVNLYRKVQSDEPISIDVRKLSVIEPVEEATAAA